MAMAIDIYAFNTERDTKSSLKLYVDISISVT